MITKIPQGNSVYIFLTNYLYDITTNTWTATDCDEGGYPKITIIDSAGDTIVDAASMTDEGTGIYDYEYQTTSSSEIGKWTGFIVSSNGGFYNTKYFEFEVE